MVVGRWELRGTFLNETENHGYLLYKTKPRRLPYTLRGISKSPPVNLFPSQSKTERVEIKANLSPDSLIKGRNNLRLGPPWNWKLLTQFESLSDLLVILNLIPNLWGVPRVTLTWDSCTPKTPTVTPSLLTLESQRTPSRTRPFVPKSETWTLRLRDAVNSILGPWGCHG